MVCILYIYIHILSYSIYIYICFFLLFLLMWFVKTTDSSPGAPEQVDGAKLPVFDAAEDRCFHREGGETGRLPTSQIYQRLWCFHIFVLLFFCFCFESSWTSSLKTLEWCCLWQSLLKVWYLIAPWNSNWNKLDLKPTRSTALQSLPVKRMMCGARIWGKLQLPLPNKTPMKQLEELLHQVVLRVNAGEA